VLPAENSKLPNSVGDNFLKPPTVWGDDTSHQKDREKKEKERKDGEEGKL